MTGALLERGFDSSSGLGFVRERLALLGKTLFLVSFGFYVSLTISMVLIGHAPFVAVVTMPVAVGHILASLTMALLWLLARNAMPSLGSLGALDALSFIVAGAFLSLDGRPVLLEVQRFEAPNATTVDTSWIDARTLRPLRMRSTNSARIISLEFDGRRIRGATTPSTGAATAIDQQSVASAFQVEHVWAGRFGGAASRGLPCYRESGRFRSGRLV